jgi:predicted DNA-binding protein
MAREYTPLTISLYPEQRERLEQLAKQRGSTHEKNLSRVVRSLIDAAYNEQEVPTA